MANIEIVFGSSVVVVVVTLIILAVTGFFTPSVDCEVSEWGPCDPLTGKRKRTVIKEKQGKGKDCPALEEDCPVDCVMEPWGPCVDGKQTRQITTESKNGGTPCGSLEQSCFVPFSIGAFQSTPAQLYYDLYYLDRHPRICPGKPISGFGMHKTANNDIIQINYICGENLDPVGEKISKSSVKIDPRNYTGLAKASVECGTNEVLSNYGLDNTYKFNYDCIKSKQDLECKEITNTVDAKIENHQFKCANDEVIGSIKGKVETDGKYSFIYNCCKKLMPKSL